MNTDRRKMITSSIVDRASTKPGQIVHSLISTAARQRHDSTPEPPPRQKIRASPRAQFVQEAPQELADVFLLRRLRVDPVANLLLLGAHVPDQSLNAFGERRDRLRVALIFDRRLGALGDDRRVRDRFDERRRLDVAGEKLLELGIEAVLRLARLKV